MDGKRVVEVINTEEQVLVRFVGQTLPGTTNIVIFMQQENWLLPMTTDFLDTDLNEKPPTF